MKWLRFALGAALLVPLAVFVTGTLAAAPNLDDVFAPEPYKFQLLTVYPIHGLGLVSDLRVQQMDEATVLFLADAGSDCIRRVLPPRSALNETDQAVVETVDGPNGECNYPDDMEAEGERQFFRTPTSLCIQRPSVGERFALVAAFAGSGRVVRLLSPSPLEAPTAYETVATDLGYPAAVSCVPPQAIANGAQIIVSDAIKHSVSLFLPDEDKGYQRWAILGTGMAGYEEGALASSETRLNTPVALDGEYTVSETPVWYVAEADNGVMRRISRIGDSLAGSLVAGSREPSARVQQGTAQLLNLGRMWRLRVKQDLYYVNGTDSVLRIILVSENRGFPLIDIGSLQRDPASAPSAGATRILAFDVLKGDGTFIHALDDKNNLWVFQGP